MDTSQPPKANQLEQLVAASYSNGIFYSEFMRETKKRFIVHVLRACNGNQCRAALELGMHRNTLSRTIAELKLDRSQWDPRRHLAGRFVPRRITGPATQQRHLSA